MMIGVAPHRGWGLKAKAVALLAWVVAFGLVEGLLATGLFTTTTADFERFEEFEEIERDMIVSSMQLRDLLLDVELPVDTANRHEILAHWQGDLGSLTAVRDDTVRWLGPALQPVLVLYQQIEALSGSDVVSDQAMAALRDAIDADGHAYDNALVVELARLQTKIHAHLDQAAARRGFYGRAMAVIAVLGLLGLAMGGGIFLVRMIRAMEQLRGQTERIAAGDFHAQLPVCRSDELGQVVAAVNGMAAGLAARDRELEGLRERFGQQERMFTLGVFAAQMGHELGNPIQAIMALSLHVSDNLRQSPTAETVLEHLPHLDLIGQHAERLAGTVRDIREFSRPQRAERELVDLNELVRNTLRLMRFEPRFNTVRLQLDLAADLPVLTVVADHIVQVLVNLLVNAADAVPREGGVIGIQTRRADGGATFAVEDNGHGMEDVVQAIVFDPFFTTKLGENGTGLGLTICKSIVDDHGGTIRLNSTLGVGTTVEVFLPQGNT